MAGQGEDLGAVAVGVVKPLHQVGVARAAGSRTHGELAGGQRVCLSSKSSSFLVADVDPFDGGTAHRIHDWVQGVTNQTINALDALRLESFYDLFCVILCHITTSFRNSK